MMRLLPVILVLLSVCGCDRFVVVPDSPMASQTAADKNAKLAEDYYQRGLADMAKDDLRAALENYSQSIAHNRTALNLRGRAVVYFFMQEFETAKQDIDESLKIDDSMPESYWTRGLILREAGSVQASIKDFSKSIGFESAYRALALKDRGIAYAELGKFDKAIEDFDRALEIDPTLEIASTSREAVIREQNAKR